MSKKEKKQKKVKIKAGKLARRDALVGAAFISPWILGALMFLIFPLGQSFWYALNTIRITPLATTFKFVGQGNFTQILFSDADFTVQLIDYLVSTIISVPVIVVFALIIAMMLNQRIKGKGAFRLIFFLPVIIVSGPILSMLNAEGAGSVTALDTQAITSAIESALPSALASPISDLFKNMITMLWYSGVQILIFLSSLQKIDPAMYEAAKIDGGSGWECFWKITLPTIKPMILLNLVYTIVFISNNDSNAIIELIKNSMFSGSPEKGYGYASAMAWLYSIVEIILVALFALAFVAKKDVYEKQVKKAKKQMKKEEREIKRIRRRSARNAARQAKIESKSKGN
ncbi:MAG: sugar ABC transporter permease [Eubacterium sp.]|nr:sugar ABC transporter permease [Eubacterium sp.]